MPFNRIKSDDFEDDWYGYATNQISHMALGMFFTGIVAVIYFGKWGEYPVKEFLLLVIFLGYAAFELLSQGLEKPWDTIEDITFFVGWGSGGTIAAFYEVRVGDAALGPDPAAALPFVIAAIVHLSLGSLQRFLVARLTEK